MRADAACGDFPQIVWLYRGRELPAAEQRRWDEHLAACPACRVALEEAESVAEAYAGLPMVDAPERVVRAVLGQAGGGKESLWVRLRGAWEAPNWGGLWRPALPLAALGLALLIYFGPLASGWEPALREPDGMGRGTARERQQAWDTRALKLSRRVAAWESFDKRTAQQQRQLMAFERDADRLAAWAAWEQKRKKRRDISRL